ncbi:unnamed protein product [Microthlaspi erraticum]|uniref:Uncharacterized protein n=1 Tax=Microthlaspi erraticum TaxID=1685480 RepID=A0A6D2HHE1_9BRAS|nr:unnamed protein product [Microthlaspi erraticum]
MEVAKGNAKATKEKEHIGMIERNLQNEDVFEGAFHARPREISDNKSEDGKQWCGVCKRNNHIEADCWKTQSSANWQRNTRKAHVMKKT